MHVLPYVRNQTIHITDWRWSLIGSRNRRDELELKVERLEAKVKSLEEKIGKLEEDKASRAKTILELTTLVIGLAGAILAIVEQLL